MQCQGGEGYDLAMEMPDESLDPVAAFLVAATVPLDASHASGTLARAEAIRAAHPEVAGASLFTAAVWGDVHAVHRFLAADPQGATAQGGPHGWDALTYLCFSNYLKLDRARSDDFVRAATALLDAGASAATGFWENDHQPKPEWESAIYGAAGVAHHPGLTRLLLERGADPNDEETPYHAPETYDNEALQVLVESGRLSADSLATILLRKADWHDGDGIRYLLEHGADPNRKTRWARTALHHALLRDNALEIVEMLLDHGADPTLVSERTPESAAMIAARRGRGDVLALLARRGIALELPGFHRLLAACAGNDEAAIGVLAEREPGMLQAVIAHGGTLLATFAGVGHLLDLGVEVDAPYREGDGYYGVAQDSTALHVAAWRARHETVKLLLARGAAVDRPDGQGRTALALAVRACVDSYWMNRRTPESVAALLAAGASPDRAPFPSGYAEVDDLLRRSSIR
jgi:ankyrin repeat protein